MKPLLVGELNPYGSDPRMALYPRPRLAAGNRLRLHLGLTDRQYLDLFDRANLCVGRWSAGAARDKAWELFGEGYRLGRPAIILLGRKVTDAFRGSIIKDAYSNAMEACAEPFRVLDAVAPKIVLLPHPSGRSRAWNDPMARDKARALLRELGALPPLDSL